MTDIKEILAGVSDDVKILAEAREEYGMASLYISGFYSAIEMKKKEEILFFNQCKAIMDAMPEDTHDYSEDPDYEDMPLSDIPMWQYINKATALEVIKDI